MTSVAQRIALFAGGAVTLALVQLVLSRGRQRSATDRERDFREETLPSLPVSLPSELEDELHSRHEAFFGPEGLANIRGAFIIVVGLGGVGSHAAHMLARAGVGRLRVVDFDQVTLSSLNRHAVAEWSDVGKSKAQTLREHLLRIIPTLHIEAVTEMFRADTAAANGNDDDDAPAFVLDCIDDVGSKCELMAECGRRKLRVVCSLAAACKSDPTRLCISSLADANRDPLASKLKWRLKKTELDPEAVSCVFSSERPVATLLPLTEEQQAGRPEEFGAVEHFRVRVLPVLGPVPAIFGQASRQGEERQAMATWVLCELGGKPFTPVAGTKASGKMCNKLQQRLRSREIRRHGIAPQDAKPVDLADVDFIISEVRG
ncbi:unnamed protein product [Phaeothamnion confervicola]